MALSITQKPIFSSKFLVENVAAFSAHTLAQTSDQNTHSVASTAAATADLNFFLHVVIGLINLFKAATKLACLTVTNIYISPEAGVYPRGALYKAYL